jgi:hypothetical protein
MRKFAEEVCAKGFSADIIAPPLDHFYRRYKDQIKVQNLLHRGTTPAPVIADFKRCLATPLAALTPQDHVFLAAFVIYRFRNNMFHGNKRVESWLRYRIEISYCTDIMQKFVAHAESLLPTMQAARTA